MANPYFTVLLSVGALLVSACAAPLAPTPMDTTPLLVPAALTLTGGTATSVNEVLLNLTVTDAIGKGVPGIAVTLTTTSGTVRPTTVLTALNGSGQALLTTTTDATVTATVGSLHASAPAKAFPVFVPPPPSVFVPPPPVVPPQPQPPTPPATLSTSLACTAPLTHGLPTPCNVQVSYGGTVLPATAITAVDWVWGDGAMNTTAIPADTHVYPIAGSYTVFATVTANLPTPPGGMSTATGSKALTIP